MHIGLIIVIFSILLKIYVLCLPSYGRREVYKNMLDSTSFLLFFQVKQCRLSCSSKVTQSHTKKEIQLKTIGFSLLCYIFFKFLLEK